MAGYGAAGLLTDGEVSLQPRLWTAVAVGLGWGAVAGPVGALAAAPGRHPGG
ncbi:hypothetical protein [Streptomyces pacificus]|uniref:hypothetical protein n=1 Tax=Streptomyces pacificus TaxID=2705029 RepID=UPI0015637EB7|nr:hypothetical protein [Streptomyces pacificus]